MGLKDFFDNFSVSSFNEEEGAFGLDFSDSHLRALSIEHDSGKIFSKFSKSTSLSKDLIRDGKILKKDALREKLKQLKEETQKKGIRPQETNLVVPVPASRLYLTDFKFSSKAQGEEIEKAVLRKARNLDPVNVEESYFDYSEVPSNKNYKEVFYAAVPKKIIEDYKKVAKKAGLGIDVFEPDFLSLARAFYPFLQEKRRVIVFDCGRRNTSINAFYRGAPRHLGEIKLGGEKFTQAIANSLSVSQKEAEKLKKERGLKEEQIRKALAPVLNSMMNQFTEMLEDIKAEKDLAFEQLLLCGGTSLMPGFKNYFEKNLNLEPAQVDPFSVQKIEIPEKNLTERRGRYSSVVGASLRSLKQFDSLPSINLINKKKK